VGPRDVGLDLVCVGFAGIDANPGRRRDAVVLPGLAHAVKVQGVWPMALGVVQRDLQALALPRAQYRSGHARRAVVGPERPDLREFDRAAHGLVRVHLVSCGRGVDRDLVLALHEVDDFGR